MTWVNVTLRKRARKRNRASKQAGERQKERENEVLGEGARGSNNKSERKNERESERQRGRTWKRECALTHSAENTRAILYQIDNHHLQLISSQYFCNPIIASSSRSCGCERSLLWIFYFPFIPLKKIWPDCKNRLASRCTSSPMQPAHPARAPCAQVRTAYSVDLGDVESKALPAIKLRMCMLLYWNHIPNDKH